MIRSRESHATNNLGKTGAGMRLFDAFVHPAATTACSLASDKPIDETYHGRYAFSEPETRNVAWVFDQFPRIRWYVGIWISIRP